MGAKAAEVIEVPLAQHVIECRRKWRRLRRKLAAMALPAPWDPPASEEPPPPRPRVGRPRKGKYVGVSLFRGRYRAQICLGMGKVLYIGVYDSEEEAARAFDAKAVELRGSRANVNFPDRKEAS